LLPSTQRQLDLKIVAGQTASSAIIDPASRALGETPAAGAGLYLTGDGGVVLLDASVTYHIVDAATYYVAQDHIAPALRRLFLASAVAVSAGRGIDDFMVVHSNESGDAQAQREAMRGALVAEANRRLLDLTQRGAGLGVELVRADITAALPPAAKFAFDSVLDATQMAQQGLAAARTDATVMGQNAAHERDRILTEARANASERVSAASAHVAPILALSADQRPGLVDQLYRDRIANIMKQAGGVNTMDLRGGSHVVLPAGQP
jgi:regulator of protease activity HflC (stomatin/prohibitin superfamily)